MPLNYNQIQKYASKSRMLKYETVCKNNNLKAIKLYQSNLRLSQSFYPLLSLLEVILRNAINEELASHFNDDNWLINQKNGFMSDPSLTKFNHKKNCMVPNHYMKNTVQKSVCTTQANIIADVTFGFWTTVFEKAHYKVLLGRPRKIFSNIPTNIKRGVIYKKLNDLRDFRNRVYHNEPIIFAKNKAGAVMFSLKKTTENYNDIKEFFDWFGLNYTEWAQRLDNVQLEIDRTICIINNYPEKKYYIKRIFIGINHYKRKYLLN